MELGENILLKVSAEADLTEFSPNVDEMQERKLKNRVEGKTSPIVSHREHKLDLHLKKCWVGNTTESRAVLLKVSTIFALCAYYPSCVINNNQIYIILARLFCM